MDYDHSKKIGNEGDVVKHAVLASVVAEILASEYQTPFIYAETHSGRAQYTLPSEGEWTRGIGRLSRHLDSVLDDSERSVIPGSLGVLQPYINTALTTEPKTGSVYYGSSAMAFMHVQMAGASFRFHVWDTDAAVCANLRQFYAQQPDVSVHRGDGYLGVRRLPRATLVLIDPVSVHQDSKKILEVLDHLSRKGITFICWTALVGSPKDPVYLDFEGETRARYGVIQTQWSDPMPHTWGCQITIPTHWEASVRRVVTEIKGIMGWDLP